MEKEKGYTRRQAARITGVSYASVDYYERTKVAPASTVKAKGYGHERLFSFVDLIRIRLVKELRAQGVSLQAIRKVAEKLQKFVPPRDLTDSRLVAVGRRVYLIKTDEELLDVLTGQSAFIFILSLKPIVQEVTREVERIA